MAKTLFYTVRQPGLSRLSLQDSPNWTALCYQDIRTYTLMGPSFSCITTSSSLPFGDLTSASSISPS
jgi:hypothetical protein